MKIFILKKIKIIINLKIILKKEDFKRFKKCFKISWMLASRDNFKIVKKWIKNKKISIFFDFKINVNNEKNNYNIFFEENKKYLEKKLFKSNLYNLSLENYFLKNKILYNNSIKNLNYNIKNTINNIKINFYPGGRIIDKNEVWKFAKKYFMQKYSYFNLEFYNKKIDFNKIINIVLNLNYNVYFKPIFIYNNCIAKCDILKKLPDKTYHLIEVKSSIGRKYKNKTKTYVDKKIKDEYGYDVAYQYYVLTGVGLKISRVSLMMLNSEYYRDGDIDYNKLFIFQDIYKTQTKNYSAISLLEFCKQIKTGNFSKRIINNNIISNDLFLIKKYFMKPVKNIFSLFIKEQCLNGKGDKYKYCQHITSYLPKHNSVFELINGKEKKTLLKYQENINLLKDIILPFTFKQSYKQKKQILFSQKQKRQILVIQNKDSVIDINKILVIKNILKQYKYPLYMYDFETMNTAIQKFDYSYPYQQIPFQYSIHIIKNNKFNYLNKTKIKHRYFLSNGNYDPRLELIKNLVIDLFSYGEGIYVAYYKSFECKILSELINYLEILINKNKNNLIILKYRILQKKINIIKNKTIDLMDFFNNFMIYKKEFYGSTSIKNIQYAFDNKFTYKSLYIQKGDMASELFRRRVENNITIFEWKKIFRLEMLKYCNRDTFSMVIIFQHIVNLISHLTPINN